MSHPAKTKPRKLKKPEWRLCFYQQWTWLFQRCNWYDFTFIQFEVEKDNMLGEEYSLTIVLLGLGLTVSRSRVDEEVEKELDKLMKYVGKHKKFPVKGGKKGTRKGAKKVPKKETKSRRAK